MNKYLKEQRLPINQNKYLEKEKFPKKQNFYRPAINFTDSELMFNVAVNFWNGQYYDEKGRLIKKGAKRINEAMISVFNALLYKMNEQLKITNFKNIANTKNNYYTKPYNFVTRVHDINNLLQQTQTKKNIDKLKSKGLVSEEALEKLGLVENKKNVLSKRTIKSHLRRLELAGIINFMDYKREKWGFSIEINPKILRFNETFTQKQNSLKSDNYKSKIRETSVITIIDNTIINNNKTNQQTDFHYRNGLQANQKNNNLNNLKTTQVNTSQINENFEDNNKKCSNSAKYESFTDEIAAKNSENFINEFLSSGKNNNKNISAQNKKKIADFTEFKKKIIANFYIFLLNTIFPEKSWDYHPENINDNFKYTVQSINELTVNPLYFGSCKTIEDYQKQANFLKEVVVNTKKGWIDNRIEFNTKYSYPNRYILNNNPTFNFNKTIKYYLNKAKKVKHYKSDKKTERKFTEKQFISSLTIISKIINRNNLPPTDPKFIKHIKVRWDSKNKQYRCKADFNYETYKYMQYFLKVSRIKTPKLAN